MHKTQPRIPQIFLSVIRRIIRQDLVEEIEGNMIEYHLVLVTKDAQWPKAKLWYELLCYLRLSTLKIFQIKNSRFMFHFNPRTTIRSLLNHKTSTVISLLGFVVGLASVFLLYFYIQGERNYDSFHTDKDKIYRLLRVPNGLGDEYQVPVTSGPFADAIQTDFHDLVKSTVRVISQDALIGSKERQFYENSVFLVDSNFFSFFSYPLLVGDPQSVLLDPFSVVISKEVAIKYFGDEDPIGKELLVNQEYPYVVTGVLGDFPANSHLKFDIVLNASVLWNQPWTQMWWSNAFLTYLKIEEPEEADALVGLFPGFVDKYLGADMAETGFQMVLELEALEDIYFNTETRYDFAAHGNPQNIQILSLVAMAILFIACFNYINLSIAQAYQRAKEVGVRKVLGVPKFRLVAQFLGESFMITLCSLALAILLTELLGSWFQQTFEVGVSPKWTDPTVSGFIVGILVLVLLASGVYPALLLSSLPSLQVMKGKKLSLGKSLILRKGLVIVQFSISTFLIIVTLLVNRQIFYAKDKDLGYNPEAIIQLDITSDQFRDNMLTFKEALESESSVSSISFVSGVPGGFHDTSLLEVAGLNENVPVRTIFTDAEYLETFEIDILKGRMFNPSASSEDSTVMIVNEAAYKAMSGDSLELIGKTVRLVGFELDREIIGVAKDFHISSLHEQIEPTVLILGHFTRQVAIKLHEGQVTNGLAAVKKHYMQVAPDYPIQYRFQDESLARMYAKEERQSRVFSVFSGISIFLACMGIFGLAAFAAQRRQKELGIRKVLGARVYQIIGLISKEFLVLVIIASVLAIPIAGVFMESWLSNFAYRITLPENWFIFLLGGFCAGLVAWITITARTYGAAIKKPTESIKNE